MQTDGEKGCLSLSWNEMPCSDFKGNVGTNRLGEVDPGQSQLKILVGSVSCQITGIYASKSTFSDHCHHDCP